MTEAATHAESAVPPPSTVVAARLARRLRQHLAETAVPPVCEALLRGDVVRLDAGGLDAVVAYRCGVLFVAGLEYVIDDE